MIFVVMKDAKGGVEFVAAFRNLFDAERDVEDRNLHIPPKSALVPGSGLCVIFPMEVDEFETPEGINWSAEGPCYLKDEIHLVFERDNPSHKGLLLCAAFSSSGDADDCCRKQSGFTSGSYVSMTVQVRGSLAEVSP